MLLHGRIFRHVYAVVSRSEVAEGYCVREGQHGAGACNCGVSEAEEWFLLLWQLLLGGDGAGYSFY